MWSFDGDELWGKGAGGGLCIACLVCMSYIKIYRCIDDSLALSVS